MRRTARPESSADEYGYRWLIFRDPDFEDLVVALNTISTQLQESGYGDRLLAAVFPFEDKGQTVYFIYNFKRGGYYPFIPAPGDQARDSERELRLARSAPSCPSRRTSPAGSRSGRSRSEIEGSRAPRARL